MKKLVLSVLFVCMLVLCLAACTPVTPTTKPEPQSCEHSFSEWTVAQDPTCDQAGTQVHTCSLCGEEEFETLAPTGHIEVTDAAVAPTCTETGLSEGKHCSACSTTLVAQEMIDTKPHTDENGDRTCEVCQLLIPSEGISYTISTDGTYYIVADAGICTDSAIILASTYRGLPVREIGKDAFRNKDTIRSIVIPEGVTEIKSYSFQHCYSLSSVVLPKSLTYIGSNAFGYAYSLKSIDIPDAVTEIGSYAFVCNDKLKNVNFTNASQLHTIGEGAFSSCTSLQAFEIPAGVKSIGNSAFLECSMTSIVLPAGLKWINSYVFAGVPLESITLPDSVTLIGNYAFDGCASLKSITFSQSVASIGQSAFSDCTSLESITFPNSLTHIVKYAFTNCSALKSVTIPASIKTIEEGAFRGCNFLENFIVAQENEAYTAIDGNLYTKDGKVFVQYANGKPEHTFEIPEGTERIDNFAFFACKNITEIKIPASVTAIGDSAFSSCSSLATFTFQEESNLTTIGNFAFNNCASLKTFTILASVNHIGRYAFFQTNLESITFENPNNWTYSSYHNASLAASSPLSTAELTDPTWALKNLYWFVEYYWNRY